MMRNRILIMCSLAACLLSGCSQSDYDSDPVTKDNSSKSMSIGVSLPSLTTRVLETPDAVKGLITTWESTDVLRVFHKYTNNGTVGTMQGFEFTSTGTGSSTTFAYTYASAAGYSFTPNSSLYAFNTLPIAGNYSQSWDSSNNFWLHLIGYGSQDGTVANLRNYDAMYGVSSVGGDGTPAAMGMKHFMSVLRFDLTNAAFTGMLTNVTFTYTASSGSSLLPEEGRFFLSNTGTATNGTITGATSWTVNNVVASSGTAPVYLMTFPDQRSGTLTITATASDGNTYSRTITLSALSLSSGSMKAYKVTLNKQTPTYFLNYYMWDATAEYVDGVTDYNTITSGVATNSCKDCPTYDQMQMYVGAGAYWDTTTSWKDASGIAHTGGLWLKKKAYISGFDAGTAVKSGNAAPTPGVPTNTGEYFFLPARGMTTSTSVFLVGSSGIYWSSTPFCDATYYSDGTYAYTLYFDSSNVYATCNARSNGFCLWSVQ